MERILLVDDSATERAYFANLLARDEFEVVVVAGGKEALEALQEHGLQAVVTDMRMPGMDGIELVSRIRSWRPDVPVVLLAGEGSESLAARALRSGAAGYVPKSSSDPLLGETVRHVIELTQAATGHQRLLEVARCCDFRFELGNDLTLVRPLQDLAQRMAAALGVCDATACLQMEVAIEQAISNAVYHGNLELTREQLMHLRDAPRMREAFLEQRRNSAPYAARRVTVEIRVTTDDVTVVVQDEGPGFDVGQMSQQGMVRSLTEEGGQGLVLMWALMDRVTFNQAGTRVTMVKRKASSPAGLAPADRCEGAEPAAEPAVERTLGRLVPLDGQPPLPLKSDRIVIGRDSSCDIVLSHPTVSHHHCMLYVHEGWWCAKNLSAKNCIRVNRVACQQVVLHPTHILSIGGMEFEVDYQPHELGAVGITPPVAPF